MEHLTVPFWLIRVFKRGRWCYETALAPKAIYF